MAEKTTAKRATKKADGEAELIAAIASMPGPDRAIGERLHAIEGAMWPIYFALKGLTDAEETSVAALVKKAVS
jgi:hypothetical protein